MKKLLSLLGMLTLSATSIGETTSISAKNNTNKISLNSNFKTNNQNNLTSSKSIWFSGIEGLSSDIVINDSVKLGYKIFLATNQGLFVSLNNGDSFDLVNVDNSMNLEVNQFFKESGQPYYLITSNGMYSWDWQNGTFSLKQGATKGQNLKKIFVDLRQGDMEVWHIYTKSAKYVSLNKGATWGRDAGSIVIKYSFLSPDGNNFYDVTNQGLFIHKNGDCWNPIDVNCNAYLCIGNKIYIAADDGLYFNDYDKTKDTTKFTKLNTHGYDVSHITKIIYEKYSNKVYILCKNKVYSIKNDQDWQEININSDSVTNIWDISIPNFAPSGVNWDLNGLFFATTKGLYSNYQNPDSDNFERIQINPFSVHDENITSLFIHNDRIYLTVENQGSFASNPY